MPIKRLRPSFMFTEDRVAELRAVVPEAFADDKINWDVLRSVLGYHLEEDEEDTEHFGFFWPGKRRARRLASIRSKGTLIPQPGLGANEDATRNVYIEGDNLEVLKLLRSSYGGRVKMIYIDPPYNTGQDFVYHDDYREPLEKYLRETGQMNQEGELLTTNTQASGRFHSNWLNMIYPRLRVAREFLSSDGLIFVSIDDNEAAHLRLVMNELFGEENFVDCIIWKKRYGGGAKERYLVTLHEYILVYARDKELLDSLSVPLDQESIDRYYTRRDNNYEARGPYRTHPLEATRSVGYRPNLVFPVPAPDGSEIWPKRQWWWDRDRVARALEKGELEIAEGADGWTVSTKQYLRDEEGVERTTKPFSVIDDVYTQHGTAEIKELFGDIRIFTFPKPSTLIERLLEIADVSDEDIVLDFFAGSSPTAHATIARNRRRRIHSHFIMVQLPEPTEPGSAAREAGHNTIADIGRDRIRKVIEQIQVEDTGKLELQSDQDIGFKCYRLGRSHFVDWQPYEGTSDDLQLRMDEIEDPLVDGWCRTDLLTEVMIVEGFPLDSRVRVLQGFEDNELQRITSSSCAHSLTVCLEAQIRPATIEELKLEAEDVFICLDAALSDEDKLRLADRCNLKVI